MRYNQKQAIYKRQIVGGNRNREEARSAERSEYIINFKQLIEKNEMKSLTCLTGALLKSK